MEEKEAKQESVVEEIKGNSLEEEKIAQITTAVELDPIDD
jgi:hypothetical protein